MSFSVTDTLRTGHTVWIHSTQILRDTVAISYPVARQAWEWRSPALTASAAVVAGVIAQSFRVQLDNMLKRSAVVDTLHSEFELLSTTMDALAMHYGAVGKVSPEDLARLATTLRTFDAESGNLLLLGPALTHQMADWRRRLIALHASLESFQDGTHSGKDVDRVRNDLLLMRNQLDKRIRSPKNPMAAAFARQHMLSFWWRRLVSPFTEYLRRRKMIREGRVLEEASERASKDDSSS